MTVRYFEVQGMKGILRGFCHAPENRDMLTPPVIIVHGYFSATKFGSARLHVLLAQKISDLGFPVYRFDFYGTGDSDGDYKEVHFSMEMEDLYRVARYIKEHQPCDKPPILVGHSFGGNIALHASGRLHAPVVIALSTIPPAKGIEVFFTPEMLRQLDEEGYTYRKGFYITKEFVKAARSDQFLKNVNPTAKIILVHGSKDEFVPESWPKELHKILNGSILKMIDDGDHNFFEPRSRREVLRVVPTLLLDSLRRCK